MQMQRRSGCRAWQVAAIICASLMSAEAVDNPILPKAFDVSLMRYNGAHYIIGTGTRGKLFRSEDLKQWTPTNVIDPDPVVTLPQVPIHGITPIQLYNAVHAPDLVCINGVFHILYNGIYHTHAPAITGPFPFIEKLFDPFAGIDPQYHVDDDGSLIYVKKRNPEERDPLTGTVYPQDQRRAEVWIERLDSPWEHSGRWQQMLWGEKRRWDRFDKENFEGPELFKHHGRYHLLYVANAMDPRTGRYDTGSASATDLLAITNAEKSLLPVLKRTTERIYHDYRVILPAADKSPWNATYTTAAPAADWRDPGFDDSAWNRASGGFGHPVKIRNADIPGLRTGWKTNDIWIRREFVLETVPTGTLALYIRHEEGAEVSINGAEIYRDPDYHRSYRLISLGAQAKAALRTGTNVIAMHVHKDAPVAATWSSWGQPAQFADIGLFDLGATASDAVVTGPSQPNVFTALNGFERWISYKANYNGGVDGGQGIDRIYFAGDELMIDGPTTADMPGYHPDPGRPSWSAMFTGQADGAIPARYQVPSGRWAIRGEALAQEDSTDAAACILPTPPRRHFLLEAWIRFASAGERSAGLYVSYVDAGNHHRILVDRSARTWTSTMTIGGTAQTTTQPLPASFRFKDEHPDVAGYPEIFHALKIIKNGGFVDVHLDDIRLTSERIRSPFDAGSTGLATDRASVQFDSIIFTAGFDDAHALATDWGASLSGSTATGAWTVDGRGLGVVAGAGAGEARTIKGDRLAGYEWNVSIAADGPLAANACVGTYVDFRDDANFTRVAIDHASRSLVVTERRSGADTRLATVPLTHTYERGPDIRQGGPSEWIYPLRSESEISALAVRFVEGRNDHQGVIFTAPPTAVLSCRAGGAWKNLTTFAVQQGVENRVTFPAVRVDALRITIPPTAAATARPDDVWITHQAESAYYLRCIKDAGRLRVFVNNRQMAEVPCSREPSQVGVFALNASAHFDTMLCVEKPGADPDLGLNQAPRIRNLSVTPEPLVTPLRAILAVDAEDDGLPVAPGLLSCIWSQVGGPGTASFLPAAAAASVAMLAEFSAPGVYTLRVRVSDGEISTFRDVTASVGAADIADPDPLAQTQASTRAKCGIGFGIALLTIPLTRLRRRDHGTSMLALG